MFNLENLIRDNIRDLKPYSSARKEFSGGAKVFLDANENNFGSPLAKNYYRYPDPLQSEIKKTIAEWNGVEANQIFVGNGSDEIIDLAFRIFCRPGKDNIIICPPTYGMYEVSADINEITVKRANLTDDFQLDVTGISCLIDEYTKLIFICSPNNPTGNVLKREHIIDVVKSFDGIVILDEAYVQFSGKGSFIPDLKDLPNLMILQTFSKAWALAGLRVGLGFASADVITIFNKVKPPYNVSQIAQEAVLDALRNKGKVDESIRLVINERERLITNLMGLSFVKKVYPSDANFLLLKTKDANAIYRFLLEKGIVVRNRNNIKLCEGCLRITVGTAEENDLLIAVLKGVEV